MLYVYVLKSMKDDKFYVGFTRDLKLRFNQHEKGLVDSTKNRRPFKLIYYEAVWIREMRQRERNTLKHTMGRCLLERDSNLI